MLCELIGGGLGWFHPTRGGYQALVRRWPAKLTVSGTQSYSRAELAKADLGLLLPKEFGNGLTALDIL
jgi:hypothetical protein